MVLREDSLSYRIRTNRKPEEGLFSIALGTATGFGVGLLAGVVLGEWLGVVHPDRLRRMLQRGRTTPEPLALEDLEHAVRRALRESPATRRLNVDARAIDGGVVELTGTVPDELTRRAAAEAAAQVAGPDAVVNRILIEGHDLPPGTSAPGTSP